MATIEMLDVDKVYEDGSHAVRSLSLRVEDGELLVLLGPSGCGKSTVLRLLAGLESLTAGEIRVGGERVDTVPPQHRDIAMVFQSYALYGHMTARQNIEFPLRMRGISGDDRQRRVEKVAELLELKEYLESRPAALSGGQQQRVAMGRALVREPRAFLLDEPLSNLDARLRGQVRTHIAQIQERLGVTTLYVTHDQVEALSLGHRVAVLREGRLLQIGPGQDLYDRPADVFVAQFLGQPGMNLMVGRVERSGQAWHVAVGPDSLSLWEGSGGGAPGLGAGPAALEDRLGQEVVVGVRPEALELASVGDPGALHGEIRAVESLGHGHVFYMASEIRTLDANADPLKSAPAGDGGPLLAVRTDKATPTPAPGDRVAIRARGGGMAMFDLEGSALPRPSPDATGDAH